jgi:hypothetical protein
MSPAARGEELHAGCEAVLETESPRFRIDLSLESVLICSRIDFSTATGLPPGATCLHRPLADDPLKRLALRASYRPPPRLEGADCNSVIYAIGAFRESTIRVHFGAIRNACEDRLTRSHANFLLILEAPPGFEPGMEVLQIRRCCLCCWRALSSGTGCQQLFPGIWALMAPSLDPSSSVLSAPLSSHIPSVRSRTISGALPEPWLSALRWPFGSSPATDGSLRHRCLL